MILQQQIQQHLARKVIRAVNDLLVNTFLGGEQNLLSPRHTKLQVGSTLIDWTRRVHIFFVLNQEQRLARLINGIQVFAREQNLLGQMLHELGRIVAIH